MPRAVNMFRKYGQNGVSSVAFNLLCYFGALIFCSTSKLSISYFMIKFHNSSNYIFLCVIIIFIEYMVQFIYALPMITSFMKNCNFFDK